MEMIERVARALMLVTYPAFDDIPGFPILNPDPDFDDLPDRDGMALEDDVCREDMIALARAAIEAMREPSSEMVDAGRDVGPDAPYGLHEVRERWEAMIDAALSEAE